MPFGYFTFGCKKRGGAFGGGGGNSNTITMTPSVVLLCVSCSSKRAVSGHIEEGARLNINIRSLFISNCVHIYRIYVIALMHNAYLCKAR